MLTIKVISAVVAAASSTKYDVFLNFRGDDTRDIFVCHLYKELVQNGIKVFIDDKVKKGDEISPTLRKAIEKSKVSLVIFSKNYASSSWCLDELVHILECKEQRKQVVIPIFYGDDAEPSIVRKQSKSYQVGLAKLEERFKGRILAWRAAMKEAADLSGWDSRNFRPDTKLIEEIVKDVLVKLGRV